jgi:hypothetical protein
LFLLVAPGFHPGGGGFNGRFRRFPAGFGGFQNRFERPAGIDFGGFDRSKKLSAELSAESAADDTEDNTSQLSFSTVEGAKLHPAWVSCVFCFQIFF